MQRLPCLNDHRRLGEAHLRRDLVRFPPLRFFDYALLVVAISIAVALGMQDCRAPWENGFKGTNGGAYATRFLQQHLERGLGVTLGGNVVAIDPHPTPHPVFYLNHPATYTLVHLVPAALFGLTEATVRIVALLLWLPAIPAMWWIARRLLGIPAAGIAALLLACTPMTAYYGPMANTDGALLAATLTVAAAFIERVDRATRRNGLVLAIAVIYAVLLDWSALWIVPMLAVLSAVTSDVRAARRQLVSVIMLALIPTAVLFAHTALLCGSLRQGTRTWLDFLSFSQGWQAGRGPLPTVLAHDAVALYGPPILMLAVLGFGIGLCGPRSWGLRGGLIGAAALLLPGVLHVLAFRGHARVHEYWSIAATPGLALAATLPIAAAQRALLSRQSPNARVAVVLLAAGIVYAAWHGVSTTCDRTEASATTFYRDLGEELNEWFDSNDIVATSIQPAAADAYAHATLIGPVDTPSAVRRLQRSFAPPGFTGRLAFLLPARDADSPLGKALLEMAPPESMTNGLLFRLRP